MALSHPSASTETLTETTAPLPELHLLPKPGRPSLFCPERTAAICAIIEMEGISDSAAGALAGVTASTLARWKQEHEGFALTLEMARAQFELAQVRAIREARKRDGTPDWRARAWLLKHSSPEGYGPVFRMRKVKTAQDKAKAVKSETCANLPETRRAEGARDEGNSRPAPDERAGSAGPALQNPAKLPETPAGAAQEEQPSGPRLSRRERRAEERRLAKAKRVDA